MSTSAPASQTFSTPLGNTDTIRCGQGFDEFMNVVLDDAEEVWLPKAATEKRPATELTRKPMGEQLQSMPKLWTRLMSPCDTRTAPVEGRKHYSALSSFDMKLASRDQKVLRESRMKHWWNERMKCSRSLQETVWVDSTALERSQAGRGTVCSFTCLMC